jgi:hypothetical protein
VPETRTGPAATPLIRAAEWRAGGGTGAVRGSACPPRLGLTSKVKEADEKGTRALRAAEKEGRVEVAAYYGTCAAARLVWWQ